MSLLMDALRKAEEAKKKAARDAESADTVDTPDAQEKQESAAPEKSPEDTSSPEIELSMADMEEVPARSAVPNLDTPIEFEDEDEHEDSVLPSSEGLSSSSNIYTEEAALTGEQDGSAPTETELAPTETELAPTETELAAADETAEVDQVQWDTGLEKEESEPTATEEPISTPASSGRDEVEDEGMDQVESLEEEDIPIPDLPAPANVESKRIETPEPSVTRAKSEGPEEQSRGTDSVEPGQKMARNVFAAKKSPALTKRNIQIAAGGSVFVLLVAMGTYFYISLNQESTFNIPAGTYIASEFVDDGADSQTGDGSLVSDTGEQAGVTDDATAANAEPTGVANLDTASDVASDSSVLEELLAESEFPEVVAVAEPGRSAADIQPEALAEENPPVQEVAATVEPAPVAETETIVEVNPEPAQTIASEPEQGAVTSEPENLISFRRQENAAAIDPDLERAYVAYQQGSLAEAEVLYRRVLASDSMQRDALLGLATIATLNGNSAEALDLYSRMLARNPRDPIARAGLMEILPSGSPASQEADLKRLLNEYPNVAALSYAYGNFLASNQRWSEAQQAYFRALQLAKSDAAVGGRVNPDYAFNLAVSLEHLNQSQPAQNYYREALAFAVNHPAGFDLVAVRSRLANMAGSSSND